MKRLIFLALFLFFTFNLTAQTIEGNWYTPIRNKLLRVSITTDSIILKKCAYDSIDRDYGYSMILCKIEKKINTNYILSSFKDSTVTYYLFGFTSDPTGGKIHMNIESMNTSFSKPETAEQAIAAFEKQPLTIVFLSKQKIQQFQQNKDLSVMTVTDFEKYAEKMIEVDSTNTAYTKKKYKFSYLYSESTGRLILCSQGFNALVKGDKFDKMLEIFYENPNTQPLFIKMASGAK